MPRRRAEVRGDGLGGTFPAYAGGFNLDTESLVFHGVRSFRLVASFSGGAFLPASPGVTHSSLCAAEKATRPKRQGFGRKIALI